MKALFLSTYCPRCEQNENSDKLFYGYIAFDEVRHKEARSYGGSYVEFVFRTPEMAEWYRNFMHTPQLAIRKVCSLTAFDWLEDVALSSIPPFEFAHARNGKSMICDTRKQYEEQIRSSGASEPARFGLAKRTSGNHVRHGLRLLVHERRQA
jgi:hypothetical protein